MKKAWGHVSRRFWLWIFGLFVGGTSPLTLWGFDILISPRKREDLTAMQNFASATKAWAERNPEGFSTLMIIILLLLFFLIILSGISKAAVIWSADKLEEKPREASFWKAVRQAKKTYLEIIVLQVLITFAFTLVAVLVALPTAYLFAQGAVVQGYTLTFIGLLIFIPASVVFGFLHLYGPIFIVIYEKGVGEAIQLSFLLFRKKFKESIILAAFLMGLNILILIAGALGFLILLIPFALLGWTVSYLGFVSAFYMVLAGAALFSLFYVAALSAGFAAFQNITWVLAVKEMIRARKLPEEAKSFAAEPV